MLWGSRLLKKFTTIICNSYKITLNDFWNVWKYMCDCLEMQEQEREEENSL